MSLFMKICKHFLKLLFDRVQNIPERCPWTELCHDIVIYNTRHLFRQLRYKCSCVTDRERRC